MNELGYISAIVDDSMAVFEENAQTLKIVLVDEAD